MAKDTKTTKQKSPAAKQEQKKELVRRDDGTIELNITVPAATVQKERGKIEDALVKGIELPGFRKGMAPRDLALKKISEEKIREELLREVITNEYRKAVEKHKLQPVINPQIHIEAFENGQDLQFTAEIAEEPKVELGDYKKAIKDVSAKGKIVTEKGKEPQKPSIDAVIAAGMSQVTVKIPNVIIEREVSRLLSQVIDEVKQLGMTLENYLDSKKISVEQLREEYKNRAERDIKLEFFLRKVADEEKITVTADDITAAIAKIEDKDQQEEIKKNPYLVASIIRQQKTIDFLTQI